MSIYERGETYQHIITIRNQVTRQKQASTCSISIYDPCGVALVTDDTMINDSLGVYSYNYDIGAAATYGEYRVVVSAVTLSCTSIFPEHFIIMPWDSVEKVRGLSGIGQTKSISDDDLSRLILDAYKEVGETCFEHHEYEQPDYCRDVGTQCGCIDGTNKKFYSRYGDIADHDGDGTVTGYGEISCGTDVSAIWKDSDTTCHTAHVTITDSTCGLMTITQDDGSTAIPSDACGIYLNYYTQTTVFSEYLYRDAVMYLAAHKCILRFGELERATAADLNSAQNIKYVDPKRMYKEYKRIIRMIQKPNIGGV